MAVSIGVTFHRKHPRFKLLTHFLPLEFEIPERYRNDPCSNLFYFHGAPYLETMNDGSIWQAGHTHTAMKREDFVVDVE